MHFTIHRADMTEDGDYHSYSCEGWEGGECDYSAGCNGPHPFLRDSGELSIYCGYCAFRAAIAEGSGFTLELDTDDCFQDDNVYGIISELLWDRGYLSGLEAHQASEAYKTAYAQFRNGTWDEGAEGPFWQWSDKGMFPFLVEAKIKLVTELMGLTAAVLQSKSHGENETAQYEVLIEVFDEMIIASKDLKMVSRAEAAMDMLTRPSSRSIKTQ